jgi:preprotein translocase subunit SecF
MWVIRNRAFFYGLSALLCAASAYAFAALPIRYSVEFTGGTSIEVSYADRAPSAEALAEAVRAAGGEDVLVRPTGQNLSVRLAPVSAESRGAIIAALAVPEAGAPTVVSESTIGPSLGRELASRMGWAFALVALAIAAFIALAFRTVSAPVASWKYGAVTILSLVHDIVITAGAFVAFGLFLDAPIDALFVTALLVILGYSVNDTIVVFDRIRENLGKAGEREREERFDEIAGRSVRETVWRSIGTSATTAIALAALAIFGGEVTRAFALALVLGVVSGTYSSIFLAAPLLVTWHRWSAARAAKKDAA